jgi:hypothetical protein
MLRLSALNLRLYGLGTMSSRNLVQHHGKGREQLNAALPMGLVRDDKLSAMAKAVALEIWSHAEGRHQSTYSVAEALKINRRTAAAAIAELQTQRWLIREVHFGEPKDGKVPTKPAWERWHLQMTNIPFTEDQCTQYTGASAPGALHPVHSVHYIGVQGEVHEKCTSTNRSEGEAVHQVHCIPGKDDPWSSPIPDSVVAESATPPTQDLRSSIFDPPWAATDVAATPSSADEASASSGWPMDDPFASEWKPQANSNSDLDHYPSDSDLDPGASRSEATPPRLSDEPTGSSGGFRRRFCDALDAEPDWSSVEVDKTA